ncbi:MAG: hypothetical protein HY721_10320, partial [Planctomycetes bacterium]|nr:hypothetical protein [Planctomycetota bacterium]
RLEVFYSRLKTEQTLHAVRPDGTQDAVLYGPERRGFWSGLDVGIRTPAHVEEVPLTHRVLRMSQPQPMPDGGSVVVSTQGGLAIVGGDRRRERIVPHDVGRAFTTPFPLPDGRLLCASTLRAAEKRDVNLGIFLVEPETGALTLIHDDPRTADYEPRPLEPRPRPPALAEAPRSESFTGWLACLSAFRSQEPAAARRGRLLRVVEGVPVVSRHSTQTGRWPVWKNHHGTLARVLGTVPLAADGSFLVEVPADRLLQLQILDSDRRVVGNQITWIYVRPGETKSCAGCHEDPHVAPPAAGPGALSMPPLACLPAGDELRYRAKAWFKGHLPEKIEERTRTVRAVSLLAR